VSGVPAGGVLYNVHWAAPVAASNARSVPGKLSKSPETPTITWLRITSGAFVDQKPRDESATSTFQSISPLNLSNASKCASGVVKNTERPCTATPRWPMWKASFAGCW
jgi:hypothetical protein